MRRTGQSTCDQEYLKEKDWIVPASARDRLDEPTARHASAYPVEDWLAFLGHCWNALVLWHLQDGAKQHGELFFLCPV